MSNSADDRRVSRVRKALRQDDDRGGRVRNAYGDEPCVYCGREAQSRDHIVPVSRGGLNAIDNMVPACNRCNNLKRNMMPEEFLSTHHKFAWRFARRAVHANPVYIEMARQYGKGYERKALFEEDDA